ncbi:MAG: hypothetical protein KDN05_18340 [Verrucomicrobiae bacterium]|nr:hypothetical protein [Verrucomicrobiae bacterium]
MNHHRFVAFVSFCKNEFKYDTAVSPPRLRVEETTTDGTDGTDMEENGTEGREETRRMMT